MDRSPSFNEAERREAVRRWAELFNAAAYFEAHEAAEEAWLAIREEERAFFKGLVHAAVACRHWQRGNPHGGRVKCRSAIAYLRPFDREYLRLDLAALLADLERFSAWMETEAPATFPATPPRARLLPAP